MSLVNKIAIPGTGTSYPTSTYLLAEKVSDVTVLENNDNVDGIFVNMVLHNNYLDHYENGRKKLN